MKILRDNHLRKLKYITSTWPQYLLTMLLAVIMISGCKDSATGDDSWGKEVKTYDLALASNGDKIGTVSTEIITEDDDAYIDEGFFITIKLSSSNFNPPFDISINNDNGYCGTFDVQPDEQAEMPCDYDDFLSDPGQLTVTAEDGEGEDAHPVP